MYSQETRPSTAIIDDTCWLVKDMSWRSSFHTFLTQVVTQPSQCIRYHHLSKIPGPGPTRSMEKTRVWKEGKRVICIRKTHVIHQMFYLPDVLTLVARCFIFARCLNFLFQIFYFFNHLPDDLRNITSPKCLNFPNIWFIKTRHLAKF
jgi:hypothetical protein